MVNLEQLIVQLIQIVRGEIIGRVRLHKIIYLLDQKGLNSSASYSYQYYGPYSDEVVNSIEDAKFFGRLREITKFRKRDCKQYSIFKVNVSDTDLSKLKINKFRNFLDILIPQDSTVLELAATIHWLQHYEKIDDWKTEIKNVKK